MVGESGCGKSTLALALCGLLPRRSTHLSGSIKLAGQELVGLRESKLRSVRGSRVSYVPQDPMAALDPLMTIGEQIAESPIAHLGISKKEAKALSLSLLKSVQLPDTEDFLEKYPHQLSGGMRQRGMIAMGLSCNPQLLIADEPTGSLDHRTGAMTMDLIGDLQRSRSLSFLHVTHNPAFARRASRVLSLEGGRLLTSSAYSSDSHIDRATHV